MKLQRVAPHRSLPNFNVWWFGILEESNGAEFYLLAIKLPIYQWRESGYTYRCACHQRVLFWHGKDGFSCRWLECRS